MSETEKSKKYELVHNDWIEIVDASHKKHILFRIRAIRDFDDVKEGDYGGYVESEDNLNQYDDSWLYSDAVRISNNTKAWGDARVYGRAKLYNSAEVCDYAVICDLVKLHEDCKVHGRAKLYGNVYVGGISDISGKCEINGTCVDIRGNVKLMGNVYVAGYVSMDGVVIADNNVTIEGEDIYIGGHVLLRDSMNVRDHAYITSNDDFISVTNMGEKRLLLSAYMTKDQVIMVNYNNYVGELGYFLTDSDEFLTSRDIYRTEYIEFSEAIRQRFIRTRPEEETK